jgi:hypothetical protein
MIEEKIDVGIPRVPRRAPSIQTDTDARRQAPAAPPHALSVSLSHRRVSQFSRMFLKNLPDLFHVITRSD